MSRMYKLLRENGLSLAMTALFLGTIVGHALTGHAAYNADAEAHHSAQITLGAYLGSGHFIESVFENWESEFLQMGIFVMLTKFLRQKGSSESKSLDKEEEVDSDPREKRFDPDAPWPVRQGGLVLVIYEHSLSIALFSLFVVSFLLHAAGGCAHENLERMQHGEPPVSTLQYVASAQFWFESFQNWQSEFLSVALLIVLSIFLRQRGSAQSKPVAAPHFQTGE